MIKKIKSRQLIPNTGFTVKNNIQSAVFELDGWRRRKLANGCFEYKALFNGTDLFIRFANGETQIHLFRAGSKVVACGSFLHLPPSEIIGIDSRGRKLRGIKKRNAASGAIGRRSIRRVK